VSNGVLSRSWRTRLLHRNHVEELRCFRCGGEIQLGERIHTNSKNYYGSYWRDPGLNKVRVYHLSCYEGLFLEL
jgi:hypothetical protein